LIVIVDDKMQSINRCELCQLLYLQYKGIVSLVLVYTIWAVL